MSKIADIIKYEGDQSSFVWKHPCEDFNSLTQLIVHEGQEAIFFMDGQALDTFGPGRYTLETQNIPKIGKALRQATGGKTPFHCQVYFISTTVHMSIKWGTDSKVRFIDPALGVPLEIGASGELNLAVSDPRKLLIKLVGTMSGIAWDDDNANFVKSLSASFRPMISTAVKTNLAACIKLENINVLEIDENLEKLSAQLRAHIIPGFEEYGLTVPQFYVTNVVLPESDPNFRRIRELHTATLQTKSIEMEAAITAAQRQVELEKQTTQTEIEKQKAERELIRAQAEAQAARLSGLAEAEVMRAKGYTERDVLQAEVQKAYAEGIGSMSISGGSGSDLIGLGVGLAAAGAVGGQVSEMFKGVSTNNAAPAALCAKCGGALPEGAKFCLECGERVMAAGTVVCPNCGNTVAQGKFCPECGHKFVSACPKCGNSVPTGAKFCLECGEKL